MMDIQNNLDNYSKDELCDIYWNIADNVWDRRIGRKPQGFEFLPEESTFLKKRSKRKILNPFIRRIESLTTEKERRKYLVVVIQKKMKESDFDNWWSHLENSRYRNN